MPWRNSTLCRPLQTVALAALGVLAGCAGRPWTGQLEGDRFNEARGLMDALAADNSACGKTVTGDLSLVYNGPMDKKALSGFLEFSEPTAYKFVVTNPFGQPLFAAAGNHLSYQAINVPEQLYMAGSMFSFALRHKLPLEFISRNWGEWLMARNTHGSDAVSAIHEDRQGRGLWITFRHGEGEPAGQSHLLVDPESRKILARILEDGKGNTVAEMDYGDWLEGKRCPQPQDINITGLKYGTEIHLKLAKVEVLDEAKSYRLPVPRGYTRQLMP